MKEPTCFDVLNFFRGKVFHVLVRKKETFSPAAIEPLGLITCLEYFLEKALFSCHVSV